jgi:adenosylmethionine-8-amino-7-oxononanoate aminotransferase
MPVLLVVESATGAVVSERHGIAWLYRWRELAGELGEAAGIVDSVERARRGHFAQSGLRGFELFEKCWAKGVFVRPIADIAAVCPPLICEKQHLETIFSTVADQLRTIS